jgi:hypothetical protein
LLRKSKDIYETLDGALSQLNADLAELVGRVMKTKIEGDTIEITGNLGEMEE